MSAQSGKINLHEKQQAFLNSSVKKSAYIGGRQSGKTTALVEAACKHARDGDKVVFGAPQHRMAKEALEKMREKLSGFRTNTRDKIELSSSGGVIKLTSFSSIFPGSFKHPDVLLMDEFAHYRDTKKSNVPHFRDVGKVYAATTPANFDLPFIDQTWDITLAPTMSNPAVKQSHIDTWQQDMNDARRKTVHPIHAGDHGLFPVKTGAGTIYKCLFCDFEKELPQGITGQCHKYAIGHAIEKSCL